MIFSTLNQVNVFLVFLFFGVVFGFLFHFVKLLYRSSDKVNPLNKNKTNKKISKKFKKYIEKLLIFLKIFKKTIINTIFYLIFGIIFAFLINFFNFGNFSTVLLFTSILGFMWSYKSTKNLVVFLQKIWYTKVKHDRESKES